jgi:hypothetical protein
MLCFSRKSRLLFAGSKFSMAALKRFCSDRTLFHKYKIQNISNNTGVIACAILNQVSLVNFKIRIQDYDNTNNRKDASFELILNQENMLLP